MNGEPFCAVCVDGTADLVRVDRRSLELSDAPDAVLACGACRDEHPRSGRYAFGGGAAEKVLRRPARGKGRG